MVNGNYILYGDRPSSESEIVDDHVQTRTLEKKKRKNHRNANDLQRTLNLSQLHNETDSVKYEKKIKEPRLLRYVSNTEVEEHVVNDKFETADRYVFKLSDEPPRRYAFAKKPKNPADGSVHYAYSRSSSSCSSPGGNLPTIVEHSEQYGAGGYRARAPSPEYYQPRYDHKLDKYFGKPRDLKKPPKVGYNGSHPDSLYRVQPEPAHKGRAARAMRLLRWPAALLTVCVALALFVYFLMPDTMDVESEVLNATFWEANAAGSHSHHAHALDKSAKANNEAQTKTPALGTKTTEIDFYAVSDDAKNVQSIVDVIRETAKTNRNLPVPPVFPSHIAPEVQYGNEKADTRNPKLLQDSSVPDDSTLKPHITHKPEKPLAIYFKDGQVLSSTENIVKAETINNFSGHEDRTPGAKGPEIHRDSYLTQNRYQPHEQNHQPEGGKKNFTSGHSMLFGISIEDAERYKSTTQSTIYNTKVSPTLPVWRDGDDSTTKKYPIQSAVDGQPQCRSIHMEVCRGVLPYDLAMTTSIFSTGVDADTILAQVEYIVASNCSDRARHFICSLLEPECSPPPDAPKMPCKNLCKTVLDDCEGLIPQELIPMFECKLYPESDCSGARSPCFSREMACGDGSCIPREQICDGSFDCPAGEDESQCAACKKNEFRCRIGGCIQQRWLCDGYADCTDGEDESEDTCATVVPQQRELGEEPSGSAPAPAVRRPNKPHRNEKTYNSHGAVESDNSKELLMTSDSSNALKRNYTRRPSPSRLTPYTRTSPQPAETKPATNDDPLITVVYPTQLKDIEVTENDKVEKNKDLNKVQKLLPRKPLKESNKATEESKSDDVAAVLDKNIDELVRVINEAGVTKKTEDSTSVDISTVPPTRTRPAYYDIGSYSAHASPCPSGELRCVDGRCITLAQLCDGTIDCSDHADEDNCFT